MYVPKLNDYVKWNKIHFPVEGWVYIADNDYITIEIAVKPKNCNKGTPHQMDHTLVLCHRQYWNELTHVKSRD